MARQTEPLALPAPVETVATPTRLALPAPVEQIEQVLPALEARRAEQAELISARRADAA